MAEYKVRLSAPTTDNKYYIHTSAGGYNSCIHIKNGSVLPNCVGYAWGRWYELLGFKPKLSRGNAEDWWGYKDGYSRGQTPKLGAVICWRKGKTGTSKDGAGHVAIVEQINSDGSIVTSNSGYSGTRFYKQTLKPPYNIGSAYTFQGFIYLPVDFAVEKSVEELAKEVIEGKWGLGAERKLMLGDRYAEVQAKVNEMLAAFKVGDKVKLISGATYYDGKKIPSWVFNMTLYVRKIDGNKITVSWLKIGAITGIVLAKNLKKI